MDPSQLKPGVTYFMATYPDATLQKPVVITYEFIREDIFADDGKPAYIFKYLPAFQYEGEPEEAPVAIPGENIRGLVDLDGLIRELQDVKKRAS